MDIDNYQDIIDVRDIIERFEELNSDSDPSAGESGQEWLLLRGLLEELRGNGGDEQWHGAWYPVTLIRDSYFEEYARDLAEDIHGHALRDVHWPFTCIDWEAAAGDLQEDYATVEYNGVTYWYR